MKNDTKKHWKDYLRLYLTGFTMGAADIVPGVSGGTIAFISGIYEELIYSIKKVTGEVLQLFLQGKFLQAIKEIPFMFLLPLGFGLLTAIFSLAKLLSYLLVAYPVHLWAFFFGLVLASVFIVKKRVVQWGWKETALMTIGIVTAFILVGAVPVETPQTALMLFLSGAIAICAMILPGISGSFLLIILGKYEQILHAVTDRDFVTLGIFTLGTIVGIAIFSRVLSWLFNKHHDVIIALLMGLMLGSLRKVWPWKEVVLTRINSNGVEVPLAERNILPPAYDLPFFIAAGLFLLGIAVVVYLDRMHMIKEQFADVPDPQIKKEHQRALQEEKQEA